jgi:hypothetical protein
MQARRSRAGRLAASTRSRHLVEGPRRAGRVLGVFPTAVYVAVDVTCGADAASRGAELVAVETSDGLQLPCAATMAASSGARPLQAARIGDEAHIGLGRLDIGPLAFDVVRWWSPRRPRPVATLAEDDLAEDDLAEDDLAEDGLAEDGLAEDGPADEDESYGDPRLTEISRLLPALPPELDDRLSRLTTALRTSSAADLQDAVAALLGLGAGLTPQGDDVLAGVLVTLAARPATRLQWLGDFVVSRAPSRTTTLSAGLLRDAADGFAIPALVDLVDAVHEVDDPPGRPTAHGGLTEAVVRLLAVGHTSGAALAHGVLATARLRVAWPARSEVA